MQRIKTFVKSWGVLIVAIVLGGATFWLSSLYLQSREDALRERILGEGEEMREAVVANEDLARGAVANGESMAIALVPAKHLSGAAVSPDRFSLFEGQAINQPMSRGEPLLEHFVSGKAIDRFSDLLAQGQRAVTLEVDEIQSNAGMLTAGDYVDIFTLMDPPNGAGSAQDSDNFLLPILQQVRVLSIGTSPLVSREQDFVRYPPGGEFESYATVTVGVDREDAARLILAGDLGDLVFMLRNNGDREQADNNPLDKTLLLRDLMLSETALIEYYLSSNSANGVVRPTYMPAEPVTTVRGRRAVKSLPVFSAEKNQ